MAKTSAKRERMSVDVLPEEHRKTADRECVAGLGITNDALGTSDVGAPFNVEDADETRVGSDFYPLAANAPRAPFGARPGSRLRVPGPSPPA